MSKNRIIGTTVGVVAVGVLLAVFRDHLGKLLGGNTYLIQGVVALLGVISAAIIGWLMSQRSAKKAAASGAGEGPSAAESGEDLDLVIKEAQDRLAGADLEKGAKLGTLPAIFVIGESGSAKTTTVVHSGLGAELLAGQIYEENNILPTPTANFWFSRRTIFVEAGGKLAADPDAWKKLVGSLQPSRMSLVLGSGHAPRAAVVCVETETLLTPGGEDAVAASVRNLRARLTEISETLGISLPVYVLFTKTDRVPFFEEYFRNLNSEEATRILGATLPLVTARQGLYAEAETTRLHGVFERLFRSECNARPDFLARERDTAQLPGIYEFPREFRKLRSPLVRFLVELCRPTQLSVGPFLRGFYFSGVRPIVVNEAAPAPAAARAAEAAEGSFGATGVFRYKAGGVQQAAAAPRIVGTRKVPEWVFLGHFFNDILLADQAAMGASASSTKASMPRRILLATAIFLCLLYSGALIVSFARNRALESRVRQAAAGIQTIPSGDANVASLDSLQRLETLRQSLETLTAYQRDGAPWSYRWGLYVGNILYPETRRLYFDGFHRLLLAQTQSAILDSLTGLPATPGPPYSPTYDSLKAYLITTSNHDKSTAAFLAPVLLSRWTANRNVDADRRQLAQKQFEFYAYELKIANPFTSENDAAAVEKARRYLAQFGGFERVYQAMLADASKSNPSINFNKRFPGSAEAVIDAQEVAGPFTKGGYQFMKAALKNPERYFSGEQWVLGDQSSAGLDRSKLGQQLADQYRADFLKEWRAYMKGAAVLKYASLPDAAKKLNLLSGNQSPLLALFWLASQNTAVELPDVANAFQPVQTVVPPSSVDRYIAAPNQTYMNALVTLQTSVEGVAAQPQGNDAAAAQTLANATAARVAARQVAQAFRIDQDAQMDKTVQKLMEDPITNVEALLRNLGPAELNGKGKELCGAFRAALGKYPFNPNSTVDATVADLNTILRKPDGALWKFYDANLQKLLTKQGAQYVAVSSGGVTLNPGFVNFFNQAAAFSESLYAGGSQDPRFTYTLKPVPVDGIQGAGLQIDGQTLTYAGGAATPKQFVWQPTGTHGEKATVKLGGGSDFGFSENDGLWSVFRFFGEADTRQPIPNGEVVEWVARSGSSRKPITLPSGKPLTVRFEVDMAGGPQVFQKGYFSRLACVSEVARP
jgi:type VI secretion system protein ImpL